MKASSWALATVTVAWATDDGRGDEPRLARTVVRTHARACATSWITGSTAHRLRLEAGRRSRMAGRRQGDAEPDLAPSCCPSTVSRH